MFTYQLDHIPYDPYHSNLEGIGYCPSSLFSQTEGHVSTIQEIFVLTIELDFKIPFGFIFILFK